MTTPPESGIDIAYRCRTCGGECDDETAALRCYHDHAPSNAIDRVVCGGPDIVWEDDR